MVDPKHMTDAEYYAYLESCGHILRRDKYGIDIFFLEYAHHNGPGCVRCGETWCHHCRDSAQRCVESYTGDLFSLPDGREGADK